MTDRQSLIEQAERIDAILTCVECSFSQPLAEYLQRDERVDEGADSVEFGCPSCGHETVEIGREPTSQVITVNGLDELEQLAGE